MGKLSFCERFVYLNREPISFDGRPYLPAFYASSAKNIVLRASRQVEKSTFLVNTILYEASVNPGIQILFVCPRLEQARVFSHARLLPSLDQSAIVRRRLVGSTKRKPQVMNMRFANDSQLFVRAAFHSADAARGISADLLLVDEFQDIASGDLPVLQETMSHSRVGRTILTGTPKLLGNHLDAMFSQSTACVWTIQCDACGEGVIMDERCLGSDGPVCAKCDAAIDPSRGQWVPRNPDARWGDGFWINHLMVPWVNYDEILARQCVYDLARFKNEVLGLPTIIGEHVVTRGELEECCTDRAMARSRDEIPPAGQRELVAGIDWGGGGTSRTAVVIGFMRSDYVFQVCRFDHFTAQEDPDRVLNEVARLCQHFSVRWIGADGGGNGHVYNRLLLDRLNQDSGLFAILYSATDQPPRRDGILMKWTVGRSATIGGLFSRVKKKRILFPRVEQSGSLLDEFDCEVAEYDDINRTVKYSHPETQPDDAMHATNYALQVAIYVFPSNQEMRMLYG